MRRNTTDVMVSHILDLVETCRIEPMSRISLARRWGVSTRSVSHVIDRAHKLFGVMVAHRKDEGYIILDAGIIDIRKLRARSAA